MIIEADTTLFITGAAKEVTDAGARALTQGRSVSWVSYDPPSIRVELLRGELTDVQGVIDIIRGDQPPQA